MLHFEKASEMQKTNWQKMKKILVQLAFHLKLTRFLGLISGIRIRHYAPYALKGADHITSPWQLERLMKNPMYINTRKLLQKRAFISQTTT